MVFIALVVIKTREEGIVLFKIVHLTDIRCNYEFFYDIITRLL
jgi:hypothetical protein